MNESADFYGAGIREIINGERKSEIMEKDLQETLVKVSEYTDLKRDEKRRS